MLTVHNRNVLRQLQCRLTDSCVIPFLHCDIVDHRLIKTVPLLLNALTQLFRVLDMVPVNAVLQYRHTAKSTGFRSRLLSDHIQGGMKSVRALINLTQHACLIID